MFQRVAGLFVTTVGNIMLISLNKTPNRLAFGLIGAGLILAGLFVFFYKKET